MKFFLDYTLAWHSPANIKAEKGTCVHKCLELLGAIKLAKQNNIDFIEDERLGKYYLSELTIDICLDLAYSIRDTKLYTWSEQDYKDCKSWLNAALTYQDGMLNPLNQKIVCPETFFDFEIQEDWANYKQKLPNQQYLEGKLRIKGTIDLIVDLGDGVYEMVDYKTGKRMDWNTGEEKTYEKLLDDSQLLMYYMAARHVYPEAKQIIVTIYYINDGGAISMCFEDKDIDRAKEMLKQRFFKIKNDFKPKRIFPDWKCTKLCHFGKHDMSGAAITKDDFKTKSICSVVHKDLLTLGIDRVMLKHSKGDFSAYSEGGGRKNVDK